MKTCIINPHAMEIFKALPFNDGLVRLWNHILANDGKPSLADSMEPIRPSDYGMVEKQITELLDAWQKLDPEGASSIVLTWCNVGPSRVAA